jgi:uncharacterized Zn finger protein (UPF0148 family)
MQRYTCRKCGTGSYSSVDGGECPRCGESLVGVKGKAPGRQTRTLPRLKAVPSVPSTEGRALS